MAVSTSHTITIKNNISEKEGIQYILNEYKEMFNPDAKIRKELLKRFNIDLRFSKAFDLIEIPGSNNTNEEININDISIIKFIELKTTKKKLLNNPSKFFFGATQNEFDLADQLGEKYKFCFVSLHEDSKSACFLSKDEMFEKIKNKRIQFQINIK
jgi:hypothetical protein